MKPSVKSDFPIFYDSNLRTVNVHGVETAMKSFFSEHQSNKDSSKLIDGEILTEENKKMFTPFPFSPLPFTLPPTSIHFSGFSNIFYA